VFDMILAAIGIQLKAEGLGAIFPAGLTEGSAIIDDLRDRP
jgi:hypothetical protein